MPLRISKNRVALSGIPLELAQSASIASAATVNLALATGNEVHITGSTGPITLFGTVPAGTTFTLIFDSTPTLTYNATSLILNTGTSDYTCAAGDRAIAVSEGSGNWVVTLFKKNGVAAGDVVTAEINAVTGGSGLLGIKDGVMLDNFVLDPVSQPTIAAGASGALTGTYSYHVTYVTADGSETACWIGTPSTVAVTSKQIELTNIPVSTSPLVVARKLYRSAASPTDVKNTSYLATISDNTTTAYTDDALDATLGAPSPWISTCRGYITQSGIRVANFGNGQALGIGVGALANNSGYACVGIGFNALNALTTGRRITAVGVYACGNATTAVESVGVGTHSGNLATTGGANTSIGYAAAMKNITGILNTAVGHQALQNGTASANTAIGAEAMQAHTGGSNNTAIGYGTLAIAAGYNSCVAIGYMAGKYSAANSQFWVDNLDRGNLATSKTNSLMYGVFAAAPANQTLAINAATKILTSTVAALPSAATVGVGYKAMVTDATTPTFLSTVTGGGAVVCPVFSDGTNWKVG